MLILFSFFSQLVMAAMVQSTADAERLARTELVRFLVSIFRIFTNQSKAMRRTCECLSKSCLVVSMVLIPSDSGIRSWYSNQFLQPFPMVWTVPLSRPNVNLVQPATREAVCTIVSTSFVVLIYFLAFCQRHFTLKGTIDLHSNEINIVQRPMTKKSQSIFPCLKKKKIFNNFLSLYPDTSIIWKSLEVKKSNCSYSFF